MSRLLHKLQLCLHGSHNVYGKKGKVLLGSRDFFWAPLKLLDLSVTSLSEDTDCVLTTWFPDWRFRFGRKCWIEFRVKVVGSVAESNAIAICLRKSVFPHINKLRLLERYCPTPVYKS